MLVAEQMCASYKDHCSLRAMVLRTLCTAVQEGIDCNHLEKHAQWCKRLCWCLKAFGMVPTANTLVDKACRLVQDDDDCKTG